MRTVSFVLLACLACSGHGRRLDRPTEEQIQKRSDSQKALAMLLSGLQPSAGFQVGGAGGVRATANARQQRLGLSPLMKVVMEFVDTDEMKITFKEGESVLGGFDYYCDDKLRCQAVMIQEGTAQGYDEGSMLLFNKKGDISDIVIAKEKDTLAKALEMLPKGVAPTEKLVDPEPPNFTLITVGFAVFVTVGLAILLGTNPTQ
mmetsp:Transcript_77725/g.134839  ORF Transcript_77725/g.134839 Transcript_77725/m.134839 type:complete len:203 (-) Transcript_77725:57-665(-)